MNVKELIEELQKLDPEKMVVIRGYESGVNEANMVEEIRLNLNANTEWYYGAHEQDVVGETQAIHIGFNGEDHR